MLFSAAELLKKINPKRSLCAFNFTTPEVAEAIVKTAAELNTPVILQTSQGEASFINPEIAYATVNFLSQKYHLALSLNLDHGKNIKIIRRCIKAGYTSIHVDGSKLPIKENIKLTKKIINLCKAKAISVEGEIGMITGKSTLVQKSKEKVSLTDPEIALRFFEQTKVDFLAVAIGEKHGLGKVKLQFDLLNKIVRLIKQPLVLHGGSGITKKDLQKAITLGIKKINFNTELRLAWRVSLEKTLKSKSKEIVPYKILPEAQKAIAAVVKKKLEICTL